MIFCTHVCSLSRLDVDSKMMLLLSALPGVTLRLKSAEFGAGNSGVVASWYAVVEMEMRGSTSLDVEGRGRSSLDISPDIVREQDRKLS